MITDWSWVGGAVAGGVSALVVVVGAAAAIYRARADLFAGRRAARRDDVAGQAALLSAEEEAAATLRNDLLRSYTAVRTEVDGLREALALERQQREGVASVAQRLALDMITVYGEVGKNHTELARLAATLNMIHTVALERQPAAWSDILDGVRQQAGGVPITLPIVIQAADPHQARRMAYLEDVVASLRRRQLPPEPDAPGRPL